MPKWTEEQELAINKDNSNIIVSAGAGSGKTAVLTARVIRKLKDGVDINKLLVLTFTNEAAGEMKDRIRKAIKKEESLKDQLDYIDGAYITTFDSFALSILRKYHYVIGVSRNISIIDSSVINIKKEEVIDKIFEELYTIGDSSFLKLIGDFCVKDDSDIKKSILKISNSLDMKLDKDSFLKTYISNFYSIEYVNNLLNEYLDKIFSIKNEIKSLYEDVLSGENSKVCEEYQKALSSLIGSDSYDSIKDNINVSLPRKVELKKEKEEIKSLIDTLKSLTIYENTDEIVSSYKSTKTYVEAIVNIIKKLDLEISSYKKKNNSYEFIDVSKMAIEIVKNNPNVCNEIKYFYNEIMVDEYQDTNDLQEIFISYIANNNVYMVGDIKQSIYRFRNANPLIFKDKYDNYSRGNNGFKIDLTKNFRSREEVLSDINKIFDKIMDDALGGADYSASHRMIFGLQDYTKENDSTISNYLNFYNYSLEDKTFSNDEVEAFIIARDIKKKISSGYKVFDKNTQSLRDASYDDFCIIMDRGTSFDLYKKIFEYENIPLVMYKDETLTSSDDILIIKNIISFIIKIKSKEYDTEFRYLYTSIARSYLFEYSDDDIFSCFDDGDFYNNDIFAIAKGIITYGMELLTAIIRIVQGVASSAYFAKDGAFQIAKIPDGIFDAIEACSFWDKIPLGAVTILGSLFVTVLSFIMILTVYGRFFKLYMYTAVAPIPLSTFAGEPTQNIGKSFLKSYAAVCLEGVIIVIACIIFSAFISTTPTINPDDDAITMVWGYLGQLIFNMLILVGTVRMSDRIVKEMMGL